LVEQLAVWWVLLAVDPLEHSAIYYSNYPKGYDPNALQDDIYHWVPISILRPLNPTNYFPVHFLI